MADAAPLLRVQDVTKRFAGVCAHDRVCLAIDPGEIRGLIGPNGAGKSTLAPRGTTVLLIEQNAELALDLAGRGYVMEAGEIVLAGTTAALRDHPDLRRAYLGAPAPLRA